MPSTDCTVQPGQVHAMQGRVCVCNCNDRHQQRLYYKRAWPRHSLGAVCDYHFLLQTIDVLAIDVNRLFFFPDNPFFIVTMIILSLTRSFVTFTSPFHLPSSHSPPRLCCTVSTIISHFIYVFVLFNGLLPQSPPGRCRLIRFRWLVGRIFCVRLFSPPFPLAHSRTE